MSRRSEGSRSSRGLRRRSSAFLPRAAYWIAYRVRIRFPRLSAAVTLQYPLRPVAARLPAGRVATQEIPLVVHQTWMANAFGRVHRRSLARFRRANSDYTFDLQTEAEIDAYMAEHWSDHPIEQVFRRARFGPLKTDIWRYCMLFDRGGVYLDISKGVSVPLSELIGAHDELVLSFDARSTFAARPGERLDDRVLIRDRAVSNWLLAVVPEHPLMREVIDSVVRDYPSYRGVSFVDPKDAILEFSGPRRLTHAFHAYLRSHPDGSVRQLPPDFGGTAIWEIPGSWVRYVTRRAYILAARRVIVD